MSILSRIFGGRRSCQQRQQSSCQQSGRCGSRTRSRSRSQCRSGRCAQPTNPRDTYSRSNCRTGNCRTNTQQGCRSGNCPPTPQRQAGVRTRSGCGCGGSCGGNCQCRTQPQRQPQRQAQPQPRRVQPQPQRAQAQDPCADGNCKVSYCEEGRCVEKECKDGKCTTTVCEDDKCTTTKCDEDGNCTVTSCEDGVCETAQCSGPGCDPIVLHKSARTLSRYNLIDGRPSALSGAQAQEQRKVLADLLGVPPTQVKDQWIQEAWASVTKPNGARKANAGELLRQYVDCRKNALNSNGSCAVGAATTPKSAETNPVDQAKNGLWFNNAEDAKKAAAELDRPVIAFFTGKGWCGPCAEFEKNVLAKPEFREWAKNNAVLLQLPYPNPKGPVPKQTADLAREFKINEVPTVVFMGADGHEIGRMANQAGISPTDWIERAKKALDASETEVPRVRVVGAGASASYLTPDHTGWV